MTLIYNFLFKMLIKIKFNLFFSLLLITCNTNNSRIKVMTAFKLLIKESLNIVIKIAIVFSQFIFSDIHILF